MEETRNHEKEEGKCGLIIYSPGFLSNGLLLASCLLDQRSSPSKLVLKIALSLFKSQKILPPLPLQV
jgi:hypothetical protein